MEKWFFLKNTVGCGRCVDFICNREKQNYGHTNTTLHLLNQNASTHKMISREKFWKFPKYTQRYELMGWPDIFYSWDKNIQKYTNIRHKIWISSVILRMMVVKLTSPYSNIVRVKIFSIWRQWSLYIKQNSNASGNVTMIALCLIRHIFP